MMWSEKYRPASISDMVGNEDARTQLVKWFTSWKKGVRPVLLVGPPGIGKTTIAHLTAKQFGYDLIGLNASDVRSKSQINEILAPVLGNTSVWGTPMIFVDEVDGIHGRSDYGGTEALIKILKEPTVPIVIAANYDSTDKMKSIKKSVTTIDFKPIPPRLLQLYLNDILKREGEKLSPGTLIQVITDSRGDIRSMINLTQSMVSGFNPTTDKSFEKLNIEDGINSFFKANSLNEARGILYSMQIDPREKINSFYSSVITSSAPKQDIADMMKVLSKADMLYGKIIKLQQWRLLRYLDAILINLYKKNTGIRYTKFSLSWPLLNRIRWDGRNIKALSLILSATFHISSSTFTTFYLPYILFCIKNKKLNIPLDDTFTDIIQKEMDLIK